VSRPEARARITAAAGRLLATRRFRKLTVDAVMAEAGLARTVFYRHFEDLPHLVLGLLDDLREDIAATAAAAGPGDARLMRDLLARVVDVFARHGPLLLAVDEAARHDDAVERAYRATVDRTVELTATLLEQGMTAGSVRPLPAREVARALVLMNGTYLLDQLGRDPRGDPEAALEVLWAVWSATVLAAQA
jgi:AcrR family transcriptional regulator